MADLHNQYPKRPSTVANETNKHARLSSQDGADGEFSASFDYVMVFPMEGSSSNEQSVAAKNVIHDLLDAGLEVFNYKSVQEDELLVMIRCPLKVLQAFADKIDYKLKADPAVLEERLKAGDAEKKISPIFINSDPTISAISPYHHIYLKYDEEFDQELYFRESGEATPFDNKLIRLKLIYALIRSPKRDGGCDIEVKKLIHKKKMLAFYPLHQRSISDDLLKRSFDWWVMPWSMPFHELRAYFGEKIALYSVFLGHYSNWLIYPSIVGLAFQIVVWATLDFSSPVLPFYSLVITVWSIFMLEYWKRKESTTTLEWGMSDYEAKELDRPEFQGHLIKSFVTGKDMIYFPPDKTEFRMKVSRSIILSFIMLVIGVVAAIYVLRFSLQNRNNTSPYASLIASVLNTVQITIFNMLYQEMAVKLTDHENHRTDTEYEDSMIVKLFVFQFINSYASFFFLAFIAGNLERPNNAPSDFLGQCGATNCMEPLSINLAIIFGTRLTLTNFLDIFIPYYNFKNKIKKETAGIEEGKELTPAENDYMLMAYNPLIESIKGYADTAVQYGFAMIFITALPIASIFSLICNFVKMKFDCWKLFTFYQRPVPTGAQDIGYWQTIFTMISVISVITNAGLICFTMDVLWEYSLQGRVWIFIGFQWVLISIQFIAQAIVPDVPFEVETQLQRMEFIKEKIIDKVADEDYGEEPAEVIEEEANQADPTKGCCAACKGVKGSNVQKKMKTDLPAYPVSAYPFGSTAGVLSNSPDASAPPEQKTLAAINMPPPPPPKDGTNPITGGGYV